MNIVLDLCGRAPTCLLFHSYLQPCVVIWHFPNFFGIASNLKHLTFWLAGRKPWPATLFLIRENLIFFASPKELCETGMAAFDLFGWHVSVIAWPAKTLLRCYYLLPRFWQLFSLGSSRKLASSWMHSELAFFVVFWTTCSCEKILQRNLTRVCKCQRRCYNVTSRRVCKCKRRSYNVTSRRVCKCKRRSYNVTSRVCASAREDLTT